MELSLDLSLAFLPKSISEFLVELSKIRDGFQRLSMIDGFVKRLEDEMKKIDAFKRELPLCMILLNDAIGRLKEEAMQCKEPNDRLVTEEFIPLKKQAEKDRSVDLEDDDSSNKRDWLSSAQLWNTNIDNDHNKHGSVPVVNLRNEEDDCSVPENPIKPPKKRDREGTFLVPLKRQTTETKQDNCKTIPGFSLMGRPITESDPSNSILNGDGSCGVEPDSSFHVDPNKVRFKSKLVQQQNPRKQRRCWSPELHRRFIEALQRLGGSNVATPKQIREFMQVDGLTNDEVKSHLQKYRLHIRKLPPGSAAETTGLWMAQNQSSSDQMKASISQSASPQGPLLASGSGKGMSSSMEAEDDEKSDGQSWRSQSQVRRD